jgi:3-isopropylmalate dehydrogenase
MTEYKVAVLAGDGIGPEVMTEALHVLHRVGEIYHHTFHTRDAVIGGHAFDSFGAHFPNETKKICDSSDAILFGSVGGPVSESHLPKWKGCETNSILALRKTYALAANLRPARVYQELAGSCPLREEIVLGGIDLLIIRELQGDVYFGEHSFFEKDGVKSARDVAEYTTDQIEVVARVGFETARKRKGKVTSVDKANVLHTSKLWRDVVREVYRSYSDVALEDMLVDNCALQLVKNPGQFDVIVTSNLFGDILSDLAAALPGSLGLCPSASLSATRFGLYEPSGGSAPDIAGKGIANPIAQILSVAMMLRYSFGLLREADAVECAVRETLAAGVRTADIASSDEPKVSTSSMGNAILERVR